MLSMHHISILYIHGLTSHTVKQPAPLASHYVKAGGPLSYLSIPFCVCCTLSYATPFCVVHCLMLPHSVYVVHCLMLPHSVLYFVLCYPILCMLYIVLYLSHSGLLFTPGNLRYSVAMTVFPMTYTIHICIHVRTCHCIQTST